MRRPSGGVAERAERGLLIRSVAPVAEWFRWDGRGGQWVGWRWGSPQRDRVGRRQDRRSSDGYAHRTAPSGWCQHAPSMAQITPLHSGQGGATGVEGVGRTFLGQVSLCLEEVRGESDGEAGSACFGQVSRRLGRLLKRLPKSRSWSDSLRILRRSASNGSLLNTSGTKRSMKCARVDRRNVKKCCWSYINAELVVLGDELTDWAELASKAHWPKHLCIVCTGLSATEQQCPQALLVFISTRIPWCCFCERRGHQPCRHFVKTCCKQQNSTFNKSDDIKSIWKLFSCCFLKLPLKETQIFLKSFAMDYGINFIFTCSWNLRKEWACWMVHHIDFSPCFLQIKDWANAPPTQQRAMNT